MTTVASLIRVRVVVNHTMCHWHQFRVLQCSCQSSKVHTISNTRCIKQSELTYNPHLEGVGHL